MQSNFLKITACTMKSNEFVQETSGETEMIDALHKDYSGEEKKRKD